MGGLRRTVLALLIAGTAIVQGCRRDPAASGQDPTQQLPLARVGDHVVSVGDLEKRVNDQSLFDRHKYRTEQARKDLLDGVVRYELLAEEALRRGYDRDPEIVNGFRQAMAMKLVQDEFLKGNGKTVGRAEVEAYYRAHQDEFREARKVRALQIVVADRATADRVAAQARKLKAEDLDGFRALVVKYSIDQSTNKRGGDLMFVDEKSTVRRPLLTAILAMKTPGEIAGPVEVEGKFEILKMAEERPAAVAPFADAEPVIKKKLNQQAQAQAVEAYLQELRKKIPVQLYEENLAKAKLDTGLPTRAADAMGISSLLGDGKLVRQPRVKESDQAHAIAP